MVCQKIQFTVEMEENKQLLHLDVLVHRDKDTLTTSVYRKKTKTDQYLHFQSHHHPQVKTSVFLPQEVVRMCKHRKEPLK